MAASSQCFAEIVIEDVSTNRAEELGVTIRTNMNGQAGIQVVMEFKTTGELKNFANVELQIGDGENRIMSAPLLVSYPSPDRATVRFSAYPAYVPKSTLMIVVRDTPIGGTGYRFKVKDFIEAEFAAGVPNIVPLKAGASIPLAVQSPGVAWKGNTFHLVRLGSITFDLDKNDSLKADIQAGLTEFDNVDYDICGAVFDAAGQMLGTARAQCKVQRMWAGGVEVSAQTIRLDFGVSLDYTRAAAFAVSVSNRKVLTPDEWQK